MAARYFKYFILGVRINDCILINNRGERPLYKSIIFIKCSWSEVESLIKCKHLDLKILYRFVFV